MKYIYIGIIIVIISSENTNLPIKQVISHLEINNSRRPLLTLGCEGLVRMWSYWSSGTRTTGWSWILSRSVQWQLESQRSFYRRERKDQRCLNFSFPPTLQSPISTICWTRLKADWEMHPAEAMTLAIQSRTQRRAQNGCERNWANDGHIISSALYSTRSTNIRV